MMSGMAGVGFFAGLISLFVYIAMPVMAILIVLWIYRIKQNSDITIEQNKEIIAMLKKLDEK